MRAINYHRMYGSGTAADSGNPVRGIGLQCRDGPDRPELALGSAELSGGEVRATRQNKGVLKQGEYSAAQVGGTEWDGVRSNGGKSWTAGSDDPPHPFVSTGTPSGYGGSVRARIE